jgi:hypothetical protein
MSARRLLWSGELSLIHLESACLQIRKVCEGVAHLTTIAADIHFDEIPSLHNEYQVGKIFKILKSNDKLLFPQFARLEEKAKLESGNTHWHLNWEPFKEEEPARVGKIHSATGGLAHEYSPYLEFPDPETAKRLLLLNLNAIRADHQWLWNRFWQHYNQFGQEIFFVELGDQKNTSCPRVTKSEGLLNGDVVVDFDPDFLADFTGEVDWSEYNQEWGSPP